MLFNAQNAGNRIFELLAFNFFWGGMPPDPPKEKGPYNPLSGHSHLLHLQWLLITKVIETPAMTEQLLSHLFSICLFFCGPKEPMPITILLTEFTQWIIHCVMYCIVHWHAKFMATQSLLDM